MSDDLKKLQRHKKDNILFHRLAIHPTEDPENTQNTFNNPRSLSDACHHQHRYAAYFNSQPVYFSCLMAAVIEQFGYKPNGIVV